MHRLAPFALAALALSACAHAPQATPTPAPAQRSPDMASPAFEAELGRYHWRLSEALDARGTRLDGLFVRADRPLQLDFGERRVAVSNACNLLNAAYTVEGSRLVLGTMASTQMACSDPAIAALDRQVSERLHGALATSLDEGAQPTLTLTNARGDVMTFRGEPTAETRYGGPGDRVFLEVAARTEPCHHPTIPDKQCLKAREVFYDEGGIRRSDTGPWQLLFDGVEGYEHEPGVRNVLRVERFHRPITPADASSIVYVLDMVIESERVEP